MKIMVCLKQVPHQDARLDINGDGSWIKEDNIKFEINSYDTYALEEALRIKERGEVVTKVAYGDWKRAGDYGRLLSQHEALRAATMSVPSPRISLLSKSK